LISLIDETLEDAHIDRMFILDNYEDYENKGI